MNVRFTNKMEKGISTGLAGGSDYGENEKEENGDVFMSEIHLREWKFENREDFCIAWGRVSNHPKLEEGSYVHTSLIKEAIVDEKIKCLRFVTASGSHYTAAFEDMDYSQDSIKTTTACLLDWNISSVFVEEAVILAKKKERAFKKTLAEDLENGDLYLEVGECEIIRAYFKYKDEVFRLHCRCHGGMFTDSYLYTKSGIVDFRHFQFGFRCFETYHISDTIQRLVINNMSGVTMRIDSKDYPVGKTITCVEKENHQEGLFSPDVVNGKGLLRDFADMFLETENK